MDVVIIGGGTAGYLAAYELQSLEQIQSITVIENSSIGIIGTGEGSTGLFSYFVDKVGERDFLSHTSSSYKLGVWYKDWGVDEYIAPIDSPPVENKDELYHSGYNIEETHINAFLIKNSLSPYSEINGYQWKTAGSIAYHFDGHEVGRFFRSKCGEKVKIEDDLIAEIESVDGKILRLTGSSGKKYNGDYFIDCSGFARLFARHFELEWDDYSRYLLIDRSMPFQLPAVRRNYTQATAMKYGWCWEIPKTNNLGCGYNFSSRFLSDDQAIAECTEVYGDIKPIKFIKYSPGSYKTAMGVNWNIIGISGGFLEPLEATTIHTSIMNIFSMVEVLSGDKTVEEHNSFCWEMSRDMRDFIQLHYFCGRRDSDFWRSFADFDVEISENQRTQLEYIRCNQTKSAFRFVNYDLLYPMIKGLRMVHDRSDFPKNDLLSVIEKFKEFDYFAPL